MANVVLLKKVQSDTLSNYVPTLTSGVVDVHCRCSYVLTVEH